MKSLVLILFLAVCAQAQTIADTARHERLRQAQVEATKVFTTESIRSKGAADSEAGTAETLSPDATAKPGNAAAEPAGIQEPDFVRQWKEETAELRTQVQDLMAQETATEFDLSIASSRMNAPRTTESAKNQAAREIDASHKKLQEIQTELAKTRRNLEENLQGPPQKEKRQDDRPSFFP